MKIKLKNYIIAFIMFAVLLGITSIPNSAAYTSSITSCKFHQGTTTFTASGTKVGNVDNIYVHWVDGAGSHISLMGPPVIDGGTLWTGSLTVTVTGAYVPNAYVTSNGITHSCDLAP